MIRGKLTGGLLAALLAVLVVRPAPAQEGSGAGTNGAPAKAAAEAARLDKVVVIGASLSAGFGLRQSMADALRASIVRPGARVIGLGDELFFLNALSVGARNVDDALQLEPTLVVAVDFLFWFGYGSLDRNGGPIEVESQRLELLERGLEYLGEFQCPLVVGDFPDMSGAVGRMLAPAQMPELSTLPLLSRRVREWAEERGDTIVVPLSELVAQLGSEEEVTIGRHTFPPGSKLLQIDGLHPTTDGMTAVTQLVCDRLVARGLAPAEAFEFEWKSVLERLRTPAVLRGR